jgi:hypothetical protein
MDDSRTPAIYLIAASLIGLWATLTVTRARLHADVS